MLKRSCRLFCVRFFTTVLAGHQTSVVLMGRLVLSNLRVRWRISHAIRRSSIERWWRVVECSIGLLCAVSRSPARTRHVLGGHAASIPPRRLKLSLWARSVCARRKLANDAKAPNSSYCDLLSICCTTCCKIHNESEVHHNNLYSTSPHKNQKPSCNKITIIHAVVQLVMRRTCLGQEIHNESK